jgi:hypothetical protein
MKFKNILFLICFVCVSSTLVSGDEDEESEPIVIDESQQLHPDDVGDVLNDNDVTEDDAESQIVTLEGVFVHLKSHFSTLFWPKPSSICKTSNATTVNIISGLI